MSNKRFTIPDEKDDELYWNIMDNKTGKVVLQHISLVATREICDLLNKLNDENTKLRIEITKILARQIPNSYEEYREKYGKSGSAENQKVVRSNDNDFVKEIDGKLFFRI